MGTAGALDPGAPCFTWEKLSPLSGWHCSSAALHGPGALLHLLGLLGFGKGQALAHHANVGLREASSTIGITHTGLLRSQLPAIALNR